MKIIEEERADRFGRYPIWIKGKDFLDELLDEIISYCGVEEVRRRLDELTCRN